MQSVVVIPSQSHEETFVQERTMTEKDRLPGLVDHQFPVTETTIWSPVEILSSNYFKAR